MVPQVVSSFGSSKSRRLAAGFTAAALAATAWLIIPDGPTVSAARAAVDPSTPVLATGTVLDDGRRKSGVKVSMVANPSLAAMDRAGDKGVAMRPIATTVTAADGSYRIWGSLNALPPNYRGPKGEVDVDLVFDDGGTGTTWSYTLFPEGTDDPGLIAPVADGRVARLAPDGSINGRTLAPVLAVDLGRSKVWAAGGNSVDVSASARTAAFDPLALTRRPGVEVARSRTARMTRMAVARLGPESNRASSESAAQEAAVCVTWWNGWRRRRPEKFVTTHGWRYAKATLRQGMDQESKHTLGVAVDSGGGWKAGGTLSRTFKTGVTVTSPGLTDHIMYNRINYRRKFNTCAPTKWVPYSVYDFNTDKKRTYNALYHNCTRRGKGVTWSTAEARNVTYGGGMDIGPISLSAQAGYGQDVRVSFKFQRRGKICGNRKGGPVLSPRVSSGPR